MTEPRDRHEAHAEKIPWKISYEAGRSSVDVGRDRAARAAERSATGDASVFDPKPDAAVTKLFLHDPSIMTIRADHADGEWERWTKVSSPTPPSYGMSTPEGDAAVHLAVLTARAVLPIDSTSPMMYVNSIIAALDQFAETIDADLSDIHRPVVAQRIREAL